MGAVNIFGQKPKKAGLSKKHIIKGDFQAYKINYKEIGIFKLNRLLSYCLSALAFLCMVSYFAVVSKEGLVKDLHKKTTKVFYENIELQNIVDNQKSFYSIDNKVSRIKSLKKAEKVMEVTSETPQKVKKAKILIPGNLDNRVPTGF